MYVRKLFLVVGILAVAIVFASTELASDEQAVTASVPELRPFSVEYKASYKLGWLSLNIRAEQNLVQLDNGQWQLLFDAKTTGAASSERSVFSYENGQIVPNEYRFSTSGLLTKDSQHQRFNKASRTIEDLEGKKIHRNLWQDNLQDNLSYILQASVDLAAGKQDLQYHFYQKDQVKSYHYQVVNKEVLKTDVGQLKTVKLERIDSRNRTIYAWFAIDYDYRLVRLAEMKNGKVAYEINIAKL